MLPGLSLAGADAAGSSGCRGKFEDREAVCGFGEDLAGEAVLIERNCEVEMQELKGRLEDLRARISIMLVHL